ncbi:hypothetical protein SCALM49S_08802 [Streptomyces californicus]
MDERSPPAARAPRENISVTPPRNGTHTLQVRSVDKADNKSEALQYTFHAGSGGFLQPSEGERTAPAAAGRGGEGRQVRQRVLLLAPFRGRRLDEDPRR